MAREQSSCDNIADEDYIDMELSSFSTFFCYSITSHQQQQQQREFEFQIFSSSAPKTEPTISPADDLFFKGNLLPLHIPSRLRMLQTLLQNSTTITTSHTSFQSSNVLPSNSIHDRKELNPKEYFTDNRPINSRSKKLKLIKQFSLGMKVKASGVYLKSLFSKHGCSSETCSGSMSKNREEDIVSKHNLKKSHPFGQIQNDRYKMRSDLILRDTTSKEKMNEKDGCRYTSSFSEVIKQYSSSSFLLRDGNLKESYESHLLKRSRSYSSEIESAVQGAIAHCKQSPVTVLVKKDFNLGEIGFGTF